MNICPFGLLHRHTAEFLKNEKVPYSGTFHGGEKGIRTLEYIPALHDFQSCAFDQLSHLSTVYNLLIILFVDTFRLESFQSCGDQLSHLSTVYV